MRYNFLDDEEIEVLCDLTGMSETIFLEDYRAFCKAAEAPIGFESWRFYIDDVKEQIAIKHALKNRNPLDEIMGVDEASNLWNLSPGYIKNICAEDKVIAKKIGNTWILSKRQENPKQNKSRNQ